MVPSCQQSPAGSRPGAKARCIPGIIKYCADLVVNIFSWVLLPRGQCIRPPSTQGRAETRGEEMYCYRDVGATLDNNCCWDCSPPQNLPRTTQPNLSSSAASYAAEHPPSPPSDLRPTLLLRRTSPTARPGLAHSLFPPPTHNILAPTQNLLRITTSSLAPTQIILHRSVAWPSPPSNSFPLSHGTSTGS